MQSDSCTRDDQEVHAKLSSNTEEAREHKAEIMHTHSWATEEASGKGGVEEALDGSLRSISSG